VARARTLTVLSILDGNRRGSVVRFLYEANLITKRNSAISLVGANLLSANLAGTPLQSSTLRNANLSGTSLWGANLTRTDLTGADLRKTFLRGATLTDADLTDANLAGALGITDEKVLAEAASLEGATMPNGQKYEDWLKDKEGGGEDGENNGPS
jgi:uncharacterized protein YjbI with pentapeptide repeats